VQKTNQNSNDGDYYLHLRVPETVRDIAGIKAAIDADVIPGPRVYPSGVFSTASEKFWKTTQPILTIT
jgi:hypothetical protein